MKALLALLMAAAQASAAGLYFQRGLRSEVLRFVGGSKRLLQACLPLLSDAELLAALRETAGRGVRVKLLLDHRFRANRALVEALRGSGVELRFAAPNARMLVRDAAEVLLGSFHGDAASLDVKLEAAVWLKDAAKVSKLSKAFEAEWRKASVTPPEAEMLEDELRALPDPREDSDKEPRLKTGRRRP